MPDNKSAEFTAALSDAANAAQALSPTTTHIRRELGKLLADAIRLEADADRLVRALKRMQPDAHAG